MAVALHTGARIETHGGRRRRCITAVALHTGARIETDLSSGFYGGSESLSIRERELKLTERLYSEAMFMSLSIRERELKLDDVIDHLFFVRRSPYGSAN